MRRFLVQGMGMALALAVLVPAGSAFADPTEVPAEAPAEQAANYGTNLDPVGTEVQSAAEHAADEMAEEEHAEALNVADFHYKAHHKNPPLILGLVNFGILLALLGWKMVPALREYWGKKSETIQSGLEEGERLRAAAAAKLEEYGQRIKDVDAEVDKLIKDIRSEAAAEKERILAEARAQAEATKKAANERIAAEIQAARIEIEREVVEKAVTAAQSLLRDKVTPADQQQLVSGFIANLSSGTLPISAGAPSGGASTSPGSTPR